MCVCAQCRHTDTFLTCHNCDKVKEPNDQERSLINLFTKSIVYHFVVFILQHISFITQLLQATRPFPGLPTRWLSWINQSAERTTTSTTAKSDRTHNSSINTQHILYLSLCAQIFLTSASFSLTSSSFFIRKFLSDSRSFDNSFT